MDGGGVALTVEELSELMQQSEKIPLLLDVRTPMERQIARLEPSILVPLYELSERVDELAAYREKPVVVYCHHGVRSAHAVAWLSQMGFEQAINLDGGIDAWSCLIDPGVPRY